MNIYNVNSYSQRENIYNEMKNHYTSSNIN